MTPVPRLAPALLLLAALASPAAAASTGTPPDTAWEKCGVPLSLGPGERTGVVATPDSAGGAFVAWQRIRPVTFDYDLYLQHVDALGHIVAGWPADGLALCSEDGDQIDEVISPDLEGGAIVAWTDHRRDPAGHTDPDIYALRITAGGAIASGWSANGTLLSTSVRPQSRPAIASDGLGGAFVAWEQPAAVDPANGEIVVQHVERTGSLSPGWPDSGQVVADGPGRRASVTAVYDGAGGCVMAWDDGRGPSNDIYAQRIDSGGSALWSAGGVLASSGPREQLTPRGTSDGAGGMVIAMEELTAGSLSSVDVTAQRIDATGARPAGWPLTGVPVCSAGNEQVNHRIVTDGLGGAFVSWDDYRTGLARVYAQHVGSDGSIATGFDADGNRASNGFDDEYEADLVADGDGGALVAWTESSNTVGMQRLTASGAPAAGWNSDGTHPCAEHPQFTPVLATDGQHGAVMSVLDLRAGGSAELYAIHVTLDGVVPALLALATVETLPDEVRLTWWGAAPGAGFTLWRRHGDEPWSAIGAPHADGTGLVCWADRDVRPGDVLTYRLGGGNASDPPAAADAFVTVPGVEEIALRLSPNPSPGAMIARFTLARSAEMRWSLLDVAGRRIAGGRFGRLSSGLQKRTLNGVDALPAGVYALRLEWDGRAETARACVVR
jgi:hypothetical protein